MAATLNSRPVSAWTRDHPDEGFIGKAAVGVTAADVAVGAGEPCLLHMALRLQPLGYRPECRDKGPTVLVHADRMQPDLNMIAETGVVETEYGQREIPRQRRQPETGRDSIGADRIPYGDALHRAGIVKRLPRGKRLIVGDGFPVRRAGRFRRRRCRSGFFRRPPWRPFRSVAARASADRSFAMSRSPMRPRDWNGLISLFGTLLFKMAAR